MSVAIRYRMRSGGKPRAVEMFEAAGAQPSLGSFDTIAELAPAAK